MAAILADPSTRALHVDTIATLVTDGGFDGVDLDYEQFAYSDGRDTWATTRPNWIAFLTELATRLHADGKLLVVSTPPVYDGEQTDASGYWVYDYESMGKVVDRIRVMAYDFSTAEPGPIAPIDWVERLVEAIVDLVPPERVVLGIPAYGRDWPVTTVGTCPSDQEPATRGVSMRSAVDVAAAHGVTPIVDEDTAEATFDYVDTLSGLDESGASTTCTVSRTVHYMDPAGVHRRSWLAHRNDLQGVALWALGDEDALAWDAISSARAGEETWPAPLTP
jgi:spore germination protein YaaH